jgi:formate dehydrogenase subunit gamma
MSKRSAVAKHVESKTQRIAKRLEGDQIRRFDIHQRIQHIMMFSSFIILAITGLPMKFSEWALSQWWIDVWGGIGSMRSVHHAAAWVMVASCVYHAGYLLVSAIFLKRGFSTKMLPCLKDFKDFAQDVKYYLGLSKQRPKFDRYNYREKFDYWAVFWGIFIMVGSGLILMFPVVAAKVLPGWAIPLSLVAHSDEAILAVGWILIVHMYFAHLSPRVFPMNKSIFTGKVPLARYREEYPLEYAEVMAAANIDPETAEAMVISSVPARAQEAPGLGGVEPEMERT